MFQLKYVQPPVTSLGPAVARSRFITNAILREPIALATNITALSPSRETGYQLTKLPLASPQHYLKGGVR